MYTVISIFGDVLELTMLTCRWYFSLMHMFRCSSKITKSPEFQNSPSSQISEFEKFPKFFQNLKNGAGPKNRLVHPELWVDHFRRFFDLAIFPSVIDLDFRSVPSSPKGTERYLLGTSQ